MDWKIDRRRQRMVHQNGFTLDYYAFKGELRELAPGNIPDHLSISDVGQLVQSGKSIIADELGLRASGRRVHVIL